MSNLYALTAIERGKEHGDGANLLPGDVFSDTEAASARYENLKAARPANEEDMALAKVRGRAFIAEAPAVSEKVEKAVKAAKGGGKAAKGGGKAAATDPAPADATTTTAAAADGGDGTLV